MNRQNYHQALGQAAQSLRANRGFKNPTVLARDTGLDLNLIRRVEGSKEPAKDVQLSTIERYVEAVGLTMGELFLAADAIYERDFAGRDLTVLEDDDADVHLQPGSTGTEQS